MAEVRQKFTARQARVLDLVRLNPRVELLGGAGSGLRRRPEPAWVLACGSPERQTVDDLHERGGG